MILDRKNKIDLPTRSLYWYHSDHLGSSTYLTDKNGDITTRYEYLPYGELMRESSYQNLSSEITTRYRFSGKEYDEVSKPFEPKYWLVAERNRTQAPQRLSEERAVRGYYYFGEQGSQKPSEFGFWPQ